MLTLAKDIEMNELPVPSAEKVDVGIRDSDEFLTFEVSGYVGGANAETSTLYPIFYVANTQCFLLEAKLRHSANGGSGATIDVEKLASGIAKGAGGSMLKTKFDITANANTTTSSVLSTSGTITLAGVQLSPGDAIALRATGTLTGARDVCVTCLFGVLARDLPLSKNVGVT